MKTIQNQTAFLASPPIPTTRRPLVHQQLCRQPLPHNPLQKEHHPSPLLRSRPVCCTSAPPSDDTPFPSPPPSGRRKQTELKVGQIVAIQRLGAPSLSGGPELGLITGCSSSGETVDVQPMEAFVKELYVISKKRTPTFEKASDIHVVNYEYAPSQDAWIVLDQDLVAAQNFFRARPLPTDATKKSNKEEEKVTVSVTRDSSIPPLDESAKKRQFFRPTKQQALLAAGLSIPLAAAFWAAFATARETFEKSPAGTDLLHGNFFRIVIQIVLAGSSVSSLVIGSALFLYAMSKADNSE